MLRIDSPTPRARFAGANGCFGWCCASHAILNVPREVIGAPPLAPDSPGRSGHTPGISHGPACEHHTTTFRLLPVDREPETPTTLRVSVVRQCLV
nr:hypothetical protein Iba_chr13eCG9670 [Ipomoea batatas]